jgi:hypothetical protein
MALTNIITEPRREITETVIGIAAVGGYVAANYATARWLRPWFYPFRDDPLLIVMIAILVLTIVAVFLLFLVHAVGESISNWLGRQGHDPRPAQRYSAKPRERSENIVTPYGAGRILKGDREWVGRR